MVTRLQEQNTLKKIFWYLFFVVLAAVVLYGYLVNKTVYNVAEREKIESEIGSINSKLSELEFKFISMKNNISPEFAYSLGFKDVKKQEFVSRTAELSGLSLKN